MGMCKWWGEGKNLFTKTLPGRLWKRRKPSNKLGSHFAHTKELGSMSFLGVLEVTLQCFPPNSEQDFHGGKGREGRMSVPCSLLLPWEITLLPPESSTQSSISWSQSQPICIVELSVSMELKCLLTNRFKVFLVTSKVRSLLQAKQKQKRITH